MLNKITSGLCLVCISGLAFGQFVVTDEIGASGSQVDTTLIFEAQNNVSQFTVDLMYDPALVTPELDDPGAALPTVSNCLESVDFGGTNWSTDATGCNRSSEGNIRLTVASSFNPVNPLDTQNAGGMPPGIFGRISWNVAGGIAPGTVIPVTVEIDTVSTGDGSTAMPGTAADLDTFDGSITIEVPAGESFYSSTPAVGDTVMFGSAVVGDPAGDQIISVSNLQNDGTSDFDISDATGTNGGATITGTVPGGMATVPADGGTTEIDVTFACTPTARGDQTGTLAIANDSDNQRPSAGYQYACAGLSPNVAVTGPSELTGSTADPSGPTANITVTNEQDGFTSTAEDVTATAAGGDAQITVTGGPTDIAPDGSFDFEVACSNAAEGDFSRDVDITWTDPVGSGSATVTVQCSITDVAPGYTSDPAPGSTIDFGDVPFDSSATETIEIGNADSVGSGADAELEITGAVLSNSTNYSFEPDPFTATLAAGAPTGTESINVTCEPGGVGIIPAATLTVQTNDGDQVYDLACEGAGDEFTFTPPIGDTLNLGTVAPGQTTSAQSISMTNNLIPSEGSDVSFGCTVVGGDTDVISGPLEASPITVAAGETGSLSFQCTPPEVASFSISVECSVDGGPMPVGQQPAPEGEVATHTVTCSGRPLVVPTMSHWGLIVMGLMLLLVGGFATRRMMG